MNNPTANDPHTLSTRYGVSVKRIEAIIRLKRLEAQWEEVRVNSVRRFRRPICDEYQRLVLKTITWLKLNTCMAF